MVHLSSGTPFRIECTWFKHAAVSSIKLLLQAIKEVLPKAGLLYSEKGSLVEVLCKPKIMPVKVRCNGQVSAACRRGRS